MVRPAALDTTPMLVKGVKATGLLVAGAGETGQTVVESTIVSVVTCPIFAGQFVTVGAQEVTVYTFVV